MKAFLLAAAVATGLLCSANPADAQFRARNSSIYVAPSYNSAPVYRGSPYMHNTPGYAFAPYSSGYYTNSVFLPYNNYGGAYGYGGYGYGYGGSYGSYYSGYNGLYGSSYSTYGSTYGGYRVGRWGW